MVHSSSVRSHVPGGETVGPSRWLFDNLDNLDLPETGLRVVDSTTSTDGGGFDCCSFTLVTITYGFAGAAAVLAFGVAELFVRPDARAVYEKIAGTGWHRSRVIRGALSFVMGMAQPGRLTTMQETPASSSPPSLAVPS